jgi:biopolymer transport protein ExbB
MLRHLAASFVVLALVIALTLAPAAPAAAETSGDRAAEGVILEEDTGLWELFNKGGLVMWAILLVSIAALAFGIERGGALRAQVQVPKGLADELAARFSRGGAAAAMPLVKGKASALSRMLESALLRAKDGRAGMEEAAGASSARALYDMRRNVRPLGIAANISPLLGLLGTVWGLIKAFDRVGRGGLGSSVELGSGIGEALYTTGFGLMVAIPALLAYHFLRARSEDLIRLAEEDTIAFIDRAVSAKPGASDQSGATNAAKLARRGGAAGGS